MVIEYDKSISSSVAQKQILIQIYNEKADWSKAFNQYTIVCEVDMIKCNI